MNPDRWQQLDELFHAALGIHYSVDRKSTRLNSSHDQISYAVFCLKKKKTRLNSSHDQISYAVFCLKKKIQPNKYKKHVQRKTKYALHARDDTQPTETGRPSLTNT